MAPFIPQGLINPELNLFFALILGIGFGYVLEQAGFSSSRKLAGVFYGYDFVVLRVFFTAGVTAMTGLLFMSYLGWIDMGLIYINPTYLYSALTGGVIMGFGFILGGFCPGTSFVGAVIGKIDAMVFIVGMFLGIFIFGHFYNQFEPLYTGSFLGNPFIYETLGISRAWFAFMLVMVALIAFAFTQMIEDRVNKTDARVIQQRPSTMLPSMLLIALMFIYLFLPVERPSNLREMPPDELIEKIHNGKAFVSTHRVIHQLKNHHDKMVLIDTRDRAAYERFTLPGAIHMPPGDILARRWKAFFKRDGRPKVFFSHGSDEAMVAWMTAARAGYDNVFLMDGGLNAMFEELFIRELPDTTAYDLQKRSTARFLRDARTFFLEGGAAASTRENRPVLIAPEQSEVIPVIGGC